MNKIIFLFVLSLVCATNLGAFSFEERVQAQRDIERVYYNHRIWPATNPGSKPAFETAISSSIIEQKVSDYLFKSAVLEHVWRRPLTARQLQAEMDRMAKETRDPAILRELFSALGNKPEMIAECLARPLLADRLIHSMYSGDIRVHGKLKQQIQSELAASNTVESLRALSGIYRERLITKRDQDAAFTNADGSISVNPKEWNNWIKRLKPLFGKMPELPVQKISGLQEENDRYFVVAVLQKNESSIRLASVEWDKRPFENWFNEEKQRVRAAVATFPFAYTLPESSAAIQDSWSPTNMGAPTARTEHTAVWTGTEMIIWGGFDQHDDSRANSGGRYDPLIDNWAPDATSLNGAPTARHLHSAVWTGTEMIIWGGAIDFALFTNSGGRYNPATDSWAAGGTNLTGAPSARASHIAVWTGTEMIIWGGEGFENSGGRYDPATDTWAAGGTTLVNAPTGRHSHTAVWTGSEMIVWGGSQPALTNTGGRYDPSSDTWTSTSLGDVPSARSNHTAVWTDTVMIVWGGSIGGLNTTNTGGIYNPSTDVWTPGGTTTTDAPSERDEHTAVWSGTEMIIWGGGVNTGGRYDPGTNTWATGGTSTTNAPQARVGHTAIWTGSEMIIWGGALSNNTGGRYDPATDTWAPGGTNISGAPHDRFLHTSVWTGTEMIVWGGHANAPATVTRQGGRYDPATNTWFPGGTSLTGVPLGRFMHTAIWTGTEMIVWGGSNEFNGFDTGGRYNPMTDSWTATTTTGAPTERFFHTAIWTGTEMIVWGGEDPSLTNTGGRYNPSTDSWAAGGTSLVNAPVARTNHTVVWTGTEMIVWGGAASPLPTDTGGRYDPATDTWVVGGTSLINAPVGRFAHTAVWTDSEMIVWGGQSPLTNTGGRYNPSTDTWAPGGTSLTDAPSTRFWHTAVWTGTEMIIWGGDTDTGGRYDPLTDSWIATSTSGAPVARRNHTAIWTGSQMIVWGGSDLDLLSLNTGGLYTVSACAFSDDFEDGILDDQWTYIKPSWTETGGALVGTPTKGKAIAIATPRFAGCLESSVEAEMKSTGGPSSTLTLFAWFVNKQNTMELVLREKKNKIILKERVGGDVVQSETASITIDPNTVYQVEITFDGTQFEVFVDSVSLFTMIPVAPVPVGTVGFQVKGTTGIFDSINVHE